MFNLSDNVTHLMQLAILVAAMCVLIIFAPSIPAQTVFAAFVPVASVLLGMKASQAATTAANAAAIAASSPVEAAAPEATPPAAKG